MMTEALSDQQIESDLKSLRGWSYQNNTLTKTFQFEGFEEAVSFIMRLAMHAQSQNHHPRIVNLYNKVELTLTSHDAGDRVTERDVKLARTIEGFSWV